MNEHLYFLYNWFKEIDCDKNFPHILFLNADIIIVKDHLNHLTWILGVNMTRLVPSLREPHIFLPAY